MANPVDLGLRIAQALEGIGIKLGSYIGKSSNVKKAMFGGKPTMFKPHALETLRGVDGTFEDALKLIEEEAQFIVNATDAEKMAFLNNVNQYKELGGPLKKDLVASKQFQEGIGSLKGEIEDLQSSTSDLLTTAKSMQDDAKKGLKSAEDDLKTFLETGGNPLQKKEPKYLGGSMHEEGQLRTGIRQFLQSEYKNGRINLDQTDADRVLKYSPMSEDDPILVFKKIYGDEAYKRAGTFPGAFEIGESFKHYEDIFRSKMGEDILKVKDKKYVGDGKLVLTEMEEVKTPIDDDDIPFAKGGRAGFAGGGGLKRIVQEIVEFITTKFTPMDAMKEINKVISKTGKYKNLKLTDDDINDIVEGTNDFVFQRDPDNLFVEGTIKERTKYFDDADEAGTFFPKTSKDKSIDEMSLEETLETAEGLGATKMAERFKLKQRYPGISEDLLTNIIEDTDPVHRASVLAKMDQAMKLIVGEGKGTDEAIDILKSEPKTKMATGGRAGYYMGGQATVEPDLSDIGHGSDALMARTRITAPGSQATTSTGLNYLLGEDNDNTRVPFNEGLSVKPSDSMMVDTTTGPFDFYNTDKFKEDSMTLLKGMYGTGKDSNEFLYNEIIKKGNMLRKQGVERETIIEIIRNNKNKIDEFLKTQTGDKKTFKGMANGGRINFQDGLNFDKAFEKILEQETKEDTNIFKEGGKELIKKLDSFTPNETQKEKEEREMFDMVKEFQTLKRNGMIREDLSFRNFQKMKTLTNLKNKILELNVKYPEKKIINDEGMVNTENLKSAIDEAEANLEISPIDGLTLKRSINTEGEQSVTSGSFDIGNLNFSSDNIEEGKLTSKGDFTFGGVDLSGMVNSNDGQILNTELGFNYDNALKGKLIDSDGYRSTELELDKTFPISDKFNLNLKGGADTQTFNGKTYKSSDLTPKLSYNDGIFNADISKEIMEGGDGINLGAGVNYKDFYLKGGNLLSEKDRSGVIGYQKEFGDKDGDLFFTAGAEKNLFDDKYTGGVGLKYKFADGGIAGLRQGYVKGGGVNLARRGFLKVLGATVAGVAAFKTGALKILGKTAKTKAVPQLFTAEAGSGAPAWFEGMVNKVLADGVDITKKAATMDGQTVKSLDTPTGKVDVTIDRMGNVDVNYTGGNTALGEGVDMRYVVNEGDEMTRGKPMDEFEATENIPEGRGYSYGDDYDYSIDVGENTTDQVKNLYSDVSELQTLGGDKRLINDISVTLQKKKVLKQMQDKPADFITDVQGDYVPD